jgi:hypothetical protein
MMMMMMMMIQRRRRHYTFRVRVINTHKSRALPCAFSLDNIHKYKRVRTLDRISMQIWRWPRTVAMVYTEITACKSKQHFIRARQDDVAGGEANFYFPSTRVKTSF